MKPINIIKLVVGLDTLEDYAAYQQAHPFDWQGQPVNVVHTRNQPRQADEILASNGSIYRVIKGRILCRQQITGFEQTTDSSGAPHCLIYTNPEIVKVEPVFHRPFQGWRYLKLVNTPKDLGIYGANTVEDDTLESELKAMGLI